jgi:hypothetical protein
LYYMPAVRLLLAAVAAAIGVSPTGATAQNIY